ncbi:MAG: hypothetical protein JO159_00855 [Acidobacteria bacterium]|nr:hypothetical protein [Acidobacteriota bacterium]
MFITCLIAKIILGGYWLTIAPVLFLPLGSVLLSPAVLRGIFGKVVLPVALSFAALGVALLTPLPLGDALTTVAGMQAVWFLTAAIMFAVRNRKQLRSSFQQLRTALSSNT